MKTTEIKILDSNTPCSIRHFSSDKTMQNKKEWVKAREFYEADTNFGPRIVTPVTIYKSENQKIYLMDAITGSLYDPDTGRCLTSSQVYMKDFTFKEGLDKKLLSMRLNEEGNV